MFGYLIVFFYVGKGSVITNVAMMTFDKLGKFEEEINGFIMKN